MAEAASMPGDRWVRIFSHLVPGELRSHLLSELLHDRREMHERGISRWRIELESISEILQGMVQRAPLRAGVPDGVPQPPVVEGATRVGWPVWRLAGPALFLGHVLGAAPVFWIGAVLLLLSLAALVAVVALGREPLSVPHVRFANAVLGGTFATLVLVLLFGAVTVTLLILASALGLSFLAPIAMHAHAFFATGCACAITGSGWVAEEWYPKRLVMPASSRRRSDGEGAGTEAEPEPAARS